MTTTGKTAVAAFLTVGAIVLLMLFADRQASEWAYTLRSTGWHVMAKELSNVADGLLFHILLTLGLLFAGVDALHNGLSRRSRQLLCLCLTVAAAMVIGDTLKELFGRARPELLFTKDIYGFYPLAGDYLHFSFPSGHTLRIFSLATGLGYIFPYLRWPALTLATIEGASRVLALKHYPSDVLFGAFIGITAAVWAWRILDPYGTHREA